jgi:hypothetical protein
MVIMAGKDDRIGQLGKLLDAQYAHAVREVRRFRTSRTKARSVPVDLGPTVLGEWGNLAESLIVLAAETAGIPGAASASKVIQALCGIEEVQAVMLARISRDVELLRMGPFRAAQEQLAIAVRKGVANVDHGHRLREAEDLLVMALGQSATTEEASVIKFNLGVVAAARGDTAEARYRLKESYNDCLRVTEELITRSADVKVFKSRWTPAAFALYWPSLSVVGVRKYFKVQKAQEAANALEGFVPFVNTVARAGNAIEWIPKHPGLRLQGRPGRGYELEWTQPQR